MVIVANGTGCPVVESSTRPATLSEAIVGEILRNRLGFDGVAFSDDLEMKALDPWGSLAERAAATLVAGCDVLPVCHTPEAAEEIVERLDDPELEPRIESALARMAAWRRHLEGLRDQRPDAEVPDLEHVREHIARLNIEAMGGHRIA
jgi:beta-N-acetylhexosaminidase